MAVDQPLSITEVGKVERRRASPPTSAERHPHPPVPTVAFELVDDLVVSGVGVVAACILSPAEGLVPLGKRGDDCGPSRAGVVENPPDLHQGTGEARLYRCGSRP